jgi:uncharacterized membrane protein YbjE (DUF340 family)
VSFDPFLYVAFAVGLVAGRLVHRPVRGVPTATVATIVLLVGLLGASLAAIPNGALLAAIPVGLLFAALILLLTLAATVALLRVSPPRGPPRPGSTGAERFPLSLGLVGALLVGFAVGRAVPFPALAAIPYALYALLALVAFDLTLRASALRRVWLPIAAALIGAFAAAGAFVLLTGTAPTLALATSLAFGWYTLSGPLVAARAGAALGLVAFLANFLRENLTMVSAPALGRRLRGEGLAALGGATAMDTTLYFVTRYGDEDAGSLALASGLILTVAASLVLPALLAFAP